MSKPFEPEVSGIGTAVAAPADPVLAKGAQLYQAQSCNACHGEAGIGSAMAPKLTGIRNRLPADRLGGLLRTPSSAMTAGGMTPLDLPDESIKALVAYLESL